MRRRQFFAIVAGSTLWPLTLRAQLSQRMRRVMVLMGVPQADAETKQRVEVFVQGLRELGWVEGRNIQLDYRYADAENSRGVAAESVGLAPDLIVAHGNPFVAALRPIAGSIPIIFTAVSDPVGSGFVENLARPGGNMTGFTNFESEIGGKWLQALNEIVPNQERALFLYHAPTAANAAFLRAAEATAPGLGVILKSVDVRNRDDIEHAVTAFAQEGGGGLIIAAHVVFGNNIDLIGALVARHRLPTIFPFRWMMIRGQGLMSYGIDVFDQFRRASVYVDRVLRGARPGDLPVQNPIKYELAINGKAAKALGLTIPAAMLARADEVID